VWSAVHIPICVHIVYPVCCIVRSVYTFGCVCVVLFLSVSYSVWYNYHYYRPQNLDTLEHQMAARLGNHGNTIGIDPKLM
jgi:hypothetical protein